MKKKIMALLLASTMALSMACAPQKPEASQSKTNATNASEKEETKDSETNTTESKADLEPVTIKWMHHFGEEARIQWAQEVAQKTNELYPHITVEIEVFPYDKYVSTLKTKIQSDDAPDLYNLQSRALLEEFVAAGYCADLASADFIDTIMEAGTDAGRMGDKIYSITQDLGGSLVFYNKKLFAENNIDVPGTYSEWEKALQTLKDSGITPIAAGYQEGWPLLVDSWADFVPALFANNPDWAVEKMEGKEKFTGDEAFAKEMERLYKRVQFTQNDPFGSDWNKACELVATGKAAMVIGGFFALDAIQNKNPDIELGAFAVPVSEEKKDSVIPLGNAGGFIVYEESKNKEASTKLLSVILSPEMAEKYQTVAKTISTVKGIEGEVEPALQDILDIEAEGRVISTSALSFTFIGEYSKIYNNQLANFLREKDMNVEKFAQLLDEEFAKVE